MKGKIYQNSASFIKDSVNFVAECCEKKKGKLRMALSGGSTPRPLYEALRGKKNLAWKRIEWFQVDERYVPENHPESNAKMIREAIGLGKKFHTFDTKLPLAASLKKYEAELKREWTFDLIILGIGADGHIASLFPQSRALKTKRLVAHTQTKIHAIPDRLTITFPVILGSKKILILLAGKEKESVLKELQHGSKNAEEFPAKKLLKHKNLRLYFLRR